MPDSMAGMVPKALLRDRRGVKETLDLPVYFPRGNARADCPPPEPNRVPDQFPRLHLLVCGLTRGESPAGISEIQRRGGEKIQDVQIIPPDNSAGGRPSRSDGACTGCKIAVQLHESSRRPDHRGLHF